jgi:MAternally affected uncoordination
MGRRKVALQQIGDAFSICEQDVRLMSTHAAQLHCLVGIYALHMNMRDQAMLQFNQAIKSTNDTDLWLYCAMNLALCYMESMNSSIDNTANYQHIKSQLLSVIDNVLPEKIDTQNTALTACSHFFKALKYFLGQNYQHAEDSLREAVHHANSEDLSIITANSFIFMGHVEFLMKQFHECFSRLTNGCDTADKIPDIKLQIYANGLLKGDLGDFDLKNFKIFLIEF